MKNLPAWAYIFIAVFIAVTANSISTIWAKENDKFSIWLFALLLISPLVFISFGLVTSKMGLAVTSGVIDSLLTLSTILIGLIVFKEWNKISLVQYVGMFLSICGIFLMLFFQKAKI